MRIIVTGGRDFDDYAHVYAVLLDYRDDRPTIVHGNARGADTLADVIARRLGYPVERHPARWRDGQGRYNPAAGFERNATMARLGADLLIAFPGGNGTRDMTDRARRAAIPVRDEAGLCGQLLLPHRPEAA